MSRSDALTPYDRGPGEPLEGFVTTQDAKDSLVYVYADMSSVEAAALLPVRWKGGNASVWNYGEYENTQQIVDEVVSRGLNIVTVPVRILATDISDSSPTVDMAHLMHAQEIAAALPPGTQVIAEPYPYIDSGQQSETLWNPTDKEQWFTSWSACCVTVAEAFPQAVAVYIGSNFVEMEAAYESQWAAVVSAVRAVTAAEVMYRCNFWYENTRLEALKNWSLLDLVDVIAVAAYFELTQTPSPSYDEVRACLEGSAIFDRNQNIVKDVRELSEAHLRPIFFGELNTSRWLGSTSAPWNPDPYPVAKWNDLRVSLSGGKANTNPPTFETFRNTVQAYGFSPIQTEQLYFEAQMPHGWSIGTEVRPHIHWSPGNNASTTTAVVWELEYAWANVGDPFPATTTVTVTSTAGGAYEHQITSFGPISGAGMRESSVFVCRIARKGGDPADTFTTDAFGISVDFHYQAVDLGSADDMGTPTLIHDPMIQARLFRAYVSAFAQYDWWRGFSIYNIGGFGDSGYRLSLPAINYIRSIPTQE